MSAVDVSRFEKHNLVMRDGKLRVRKALFTALTPTSGTAFTAGSSIESPSTTETWHYLVEQSTTTGVCTLRVVTEDMLALYTYDLGVLTGNPVFSFAVNNSQVMINSPALSAPLYGLVGGGLTTALKQVSENDDTTAIDIPTGHMCSFGDRVAIASGRTVYFSDPDFDPRTFVGENTWVVDGQVLDLFQGPEGSLYAVTSNNVNVLPADALGKGQQVVGFTSIIPGINPSRPRNAAVSNGVVGVLASDSLLFISGNRPKIDLAPYEGRRFYSLPIEVEDLRTSAQLFATSNGFLVGFTGKPFALLVDLRNDFQTFIWTKASATLSAVGVLRGRDGDDLLVFRDRVVQLSGSIDFDGSDVRGIACGELEMPPGKAGVVRSVTVSADSASQPTLVSAGSFETTSTTAVRADDVTVAVSNWAATGQLAGRSMRSTLHRTVVRDGDLHVEVGTDGANRVLGGVDIDVRGQARNRRDRP